MAAPGDRRRIAMTPERWNKLEALFNEALELQGEARSAHLTKVCGDDRRLRDEAEKLIAAHEMEGSFIDSIDSPILAEIAGLTGASRIETPVGRRIGPYQVTSQIARGGMGEVFLAEDIRLERKVALKVLLAAFTQNPERVRRFEREAKAASALNHPNILTIHEIGEADGAHYIVSEFVEGETLRERMRRGPLSMAAALDVARQVAGALAAAHAAGIAHRDIKPENVMARPDGLVKVLDFGLAKLTEMRIADCGLRIEEAEMLARTSQDIPQSAIRNPHSTEPGVVMGTVSYMSPEQARGEKVDHRTDIFSLGVMLYEMLAGRRPYAGATPGETIAAVLRDEPPELSETNAKVGSHLEKIVRRCLEKKPERRFQSARDLAFALETLSGASAPGTAAQVVAPVQSRRRRWLLPAAAVLISTVAIAAFFAGKRPEKAPPEFQRLTCRHGLIGAARFAPDGQTVIYSATWQGDQRQLYSTSPENPESRPLGQLDTDLLAISAAGEMALALHPSRLGFDLKGTLAQMPLTANAPRPVIQDVFAADWPSDGRRLAIAHEVNRRYRLEFPIGTTLYETARRIPRLRISPNGDWIAFEEGEGTIAVVDLARRKKTLSSGWNSTVGIVWSPGGDEIWFTAAETGFNTALYAVTLAGEQRMVARVPYTLRLYDISRDGRVLLGSNNISKGIKHLSRGETQERDLSWLDWGHVADISTDGKMLLFSEAGEGGGAGQAVYLRKTDGSPAIRLGGGIAQALSPDGEWALTIHIARSSSEVIRKVLLLPIGAGEAKTLTDDQIFWQRAIWFPDGKRILLNGAEQGQSVRSYVLDLEGGKPRPVLPEGIVGRLVSPDGQWLIVSDPQQKLSLFPVAGGEPRLIPGQADGDAPIQWSADGRSIYVHQDGGELNIMRVYQLDLSTGRRDLRKEYVPADPVRAFRTLPIALTPDGKSYAYTYGRSSLDLYLVTGLK